MKKEKKCKFCNEVIMYLLLDNHKKIIYFKNSMLHLDFIDPLKSIDEVLKYFKGCNTLNSGTEPKIYVLYFSLKSCIQKFDFAQFLNIGLLSMTIKY